MAIESDTQVVYFLSIKKQYMYQKSSLTRAVHGSDLTIIRQPSDHIRVAVGLVGLVRWSFFVTVEWLWSVNNLLRERDREKGLG